MREKEPEDMDHGQGQAQEDEKVIVYLGVDDKPLSLLLPQTGDELSQQEKRILTCSQDYLQAYNTDLKHITQNQELIAALPGDILATPAEEFQAQKSTLDISDIFEPTVKRIRLIQGSFVAINTSGQYVAQRYGYVCIAGDTISISSPLKLSSDRLQAHWLITSIHPKNITSAMIYTWVRHHKLVVLDESIIEVIISNLNNQLLVPDLHKIISGQQPVGGSDGEIEWLISVGKTIGREMHDGSIDFRERNYVVTVAKDQPLAIVHPPSSYIDGMDIHGNAITARKGEPAKISAGSNIVCVQKGGNIEYRATCNGVAYFEGQTLFVAEVLILEGGVNYQTGNIDFAGDVIINGSITSGFAVEAEGNIQINGSVENGCTITSGRNIKVTKSIVGKRSFVRSQGTLHSYSITEATIRAAGDIYIESYSLHARIHTSGSLFIRKGDVADGGLLVGGECLVTNQLDVFTAGSPAWVPTKIIVGVSSEQTDQLENIEDSIRSRNQQMMQLLDFFEVTHVDIDQIRMKIDKATGVAKKTMALRAKYLANAGKSLKELFGRREHLVAQLGPAPETSSISIRENAYPNVSITMGSRKKKIEQETGPIFFSIQNDNLISRKLNSNS